MSPYPPYFAFYMSVENIWLFVYVLSRVFPGLMDGWMDGYLGYHQQQSPYSIKKIFLSINTDKKKQLITAAVMLCTGVSQPASVPASSQHGDAFL